MRIGLFGSTGFIGKHLKDYLAASYTIYQFSIRDKENWSDIKKCDVIVNLVGKAHDHKGTVTEQDYYDVNLDLMKEIFKQFILSDAGMFIHISSLAALEEYESSKPLLETDICNPKSFYGKSKRAAEEWLLKQKVNSDKKIIIIRPPMVHGSGDKGNLSLLTKLISKGIPYPLASFDNKRSFIYIDNFCFFIKSITENQNKLDSGIYHVSDDQALSTQTIISIIQKEYGKNVFNLSVPRFLIISLAKIGDFLPILINTSRLKKMTSNLLISSLKIKKSLEIQDLPYTAEEGLKKTIRAFIDKK